MKVIVNGFMKHGTHAALKACELLGVNAQHGHWKMKKLPEDATHHVFIKRDPRDALVSFLRFIGQPVTQGTVMRRIRKYQRASLEKEMAEFLAGYHEGIFTLRFEELIATDKEMRRLAQYLGVPYLEDAFPNLPNHTQTWTGRYSDHRTVWTPEVEAVWRAEGGDSILAAWGY